MEFYYLGVKKLPTDIVIVFWCFLAFYTEVCFKMKEMEIFTLLDLIYN